MAKTLEKSTSLSLGDVVVHQDDNGRFSINDLHQAAGGASRHKPNNWLRRSETKALITEISNCSDLSNWNPVEISVGQYGGTYVARELVYAYAMWISPAFTLKVIRTFDAVMMGQLQQVRQEAQQAIEAANLRAVTHSAPIAQQQAHLIQGRRLIQEIRTMQDPADRLQSHMELELLYRSFGKVPEPLETMWSPLKAIETGPSKAELQDQLEEWQAVCRQLLSALAGLERDVWPALYPPGMKEVPPAVAAARKAMSVARALKGGAA